MSTDNLGASFAKQFGTLIIGCSKIEYHLFIIIKKSNYLKEKYDALKKKDFYHILDLFKKETIGDDWRAALENMEKIRRMRNKIGHGLMVLHNDHVEAFEEFYRKSESDKIYLDHLVELNKISENISFQLYNSIMSFCNDPERKPINLPILEIPQKI